MTRAEHHGHQLRAHEDTLLTTQPLQAARILLVEDEFLIAMDVEQLCRDHGARDVRIVSNHAELGPGLLSEPAFDAAILDIKVQGQWTVDFARLLVERNLPFIFATGYSDMEIFFKDFPGVSVVGKPYTGDKFIEALSATIRAGLGAAHDGSDILSDA
jgi:DNA-binding NarL/FixJ family response regulator